MEKHLMSSLKNRKTEQKKWHFLIFLMILPAAHSWTSSLTWKGQSQPPWAALSDDLQSYMGWFAAAALMCRDTGHTLWLWDPFPETSGDTSPEGSLPHCWKLSFSKGDTSQPWTLLSGPHCSQFPGVITVSVKPQHQGTLQHHFCLQQLA